ncbi:DUF3108 domain-containing protein [Stenotrophomonas rhizophila]|uniref:DUF3108 domain-containing protein n=1 Tax=Stenotrophomonas rhizophila TaxID=216778 RepID=UPI001E40BADB|nr:DUF3108 domain-containing protein [Stenotrophomonas rhizophila]MCC7635156.1 DUF3108 domain-containing protein [Stenotrophomonas rhizophila]MCC7664828.1 DUF3108 domain-containing protein [Stenotrophomonas rhizophila]
MNLLNRPLTWVAAAALSMASLPAMALQPFKADYQASYMGMQANGTMTLTSEGANKWRYSLNVKNQLADLSQNTVFEEANGRLRPLTSSDRSVLLVKKRNVDATYNWSSNQASWTGDIKPDRRGPVALKAGDMDALLINLAIARDVAAGKPLNYRMVDEGRIKPMSYKVIGQEKITVAGKSYDATKVSRVDGNKEQIAWIVKEFPVPARLLQREGGKDALDLTIKGMN